MANNKVITIKFFSDKEIQIPIEQIPWILGLIKCDNIYINDLCQHSSLVDSNFRELVNFYMTSKNSISHSRINFSSLSAKLESKLSKMKLDMQKKEKKKVKNLYYKECWEITESVKMFIPNIEQREFKKFDIDHIVPISYGFQHNIPPQLIGSLENLRLISNKDNFQKTNKLTEDSIFLLRKWGYEIEYR